MLIVALRTIVETLLLVSTSRLLPNRPCMHFLVETAVDTLVEAVMLLSETLNETLVPSEPQQGMLHQGTYRDGELFPVASGRKRRLVPEDKVAPWPTEGMLNICRLVYAAFQLCMAQVVEHTLQQLWLTRLVLLYHSHDVVVLLLSCSRSRCDRVSSTSPW